MAELVMAPGAARPETAAARNDAPAGVDETSFAQILDAEVQATAETETSSDAAAAVAQAATAAPPQAQPAPAPANAVDLLISLQSADAPAVQTEAQAAEATPATVAAPAAAVVMPGVPTEQSAAATPAPADSAPAAPTPETAPQAAVETADFAQPARAGVAAATAPPAAKAAQAVNADNESLEDSDATASTGDPSAEAKAVAPVDFPAALPSPTENSTAPTVNTPAQGAVVAAAAPMRMPKPAAPSEAPAEESAAPQVQPAADREAPAAEMQMASAKPEASAVNAASSQTAAAAKQRAATQAGVQTVAAGTTPDVKTDAPAQPSSSTSTSFADLLAAGRGMADVSKAAPAHQAMQSAPPAVVQVYTRFVERFDGRAQRFEVSLTPAELGRVDIRIEVGADKKVHAVLAAHDSAALTDLVRGQRALERALTDAGIDLKDGGVKFELANDSGRSLAGQEQRRDAWNGDDMNVWRGFSSVDVAVETDAPVATASYRRASRLDLVA